MSNSLNTNNIWGGQNLLLRRRMLMMTGDLPLGYSALKYISSSGNQNIILCKNLTLAYYKIIANVMYTRSGDNTFLCSSSGLSPIFWNYMVSRLQIITNGNSLDIGLTGVPINTKFKQEFRTTENGVDVYYDDNDFHHTFSSTPTPVSVTYLYLFGFSYKMTGRIYDFKLETDEVIFNLIPAIRNSDNVPGMYDIINKEFLVNGGTGTFGYETLDGTIVDPT